MPLKYIHKELGIAPPPQTVNEFLLSLGLSRHVVGNSVQGRELVAYSLNITDNDESSTICQDELPTILFLSLVHGNEPMGLVALLTAAEMLTRPSSQDSSSVRGTSRHRRRLSARIVFFPIVNIDAYTLNLQHGKGCRRTNLREVCPYTKQQDQVSDCPSLTDDGVDLNRNYPIDWVNDTSSNDRSICSYEYGGPSPFSEPETRAVRAIVHNWNVSAAMSFHSRRDSEGPPLLIHPYTSDRHFSEMPQDQQSRYRAWSQVLSTPLTSSRQLPPSYVTGTAEEAIHYTAGGSTIDWMQSRNMTSFAVEVLPPCESRWCHANVPLVWETARRDGVTAWRFVELVVTGKVDLEKERQRLGMEEDGSSFGWFLRAELPVFLLCCILWSSSRRIVSLWRQIRPKEKQVSVEMQSLVVAAT
jgi:hypothetical protein